MDPPSDQRGALENLVADYCQFIDRRDRDGFVALWTVDAVYDFPNGHGLFRGQEGVGAGFDAVARSWLRTFHWTTNLHVDLGPGGRARGRADAFVILERNDRTVSLLAATYHDEYQLTPSGWRYSSRAVTRWFVTDGLLASLGTL